MFPTHPEDFSPYPSDLSATDVFLHQLGILGFRVFLQFDSVANVHL